MCSHGIPVLERNYRGLITGRIKSSLDDEGRQQQSNELHQYGRHDERQHDGADAEVVR